MALTLAMVETAIEEILTTGQSIGMDGMTRTAASLPALREMRKELKTEGGTGGAHAFGYRVRPLKPPEH
jgi:hypothetical protein